MILSRPLLLATASAVAKELATRRLQGPGDTACPCVLETDPLPAGYTDASFTQYYNHDGVLEVYHESIGQTVVYYEGYGFSGCGVHDDFAGNPLCPSGDVQPFVATSGSRPAWCDQMWCFVDANNCNDPYVAQESQYFSLADVYYSYRTCGYENFFARQANVADMSAEQIFDSVTEYVRNLQDSIEGIDGDYVFQRNSDLCSRQDWYACDCASCVWENSWQYSINHNHVNGWGRKEAVEDLKCPAEPMAQFFGDITRKVYSDPDRIAYVYYGHADNGAMIQWPATDASHECDSVKSYDARFRPWYVQAASGPKNIVLVLDASGSMRNNGRWNLMKEGVEQVLKTLTKYDYVGVILFHREFTAFNDHLNLYQANDNTKASINDWLAFESPGGSTSFTDGFQAAFEMLTNGRSTSR